MRRLIIFSRSSTGLNPSLLNAHIVDMEDAEFAFGAFGVVFRVLTCDGHKITPQVIKLLTAPKNVAQRAFQTIRELQARLSAKNKTLLTFGTNLLNEYPSLQAVPQLSFEGELNGQAVIGYFANNLTALGFDKFCTILEDIGKFNQFKMLPLDSKLQLALQLVTSLRLLSNELRFIHADIKPDSIFIDLTGVRCAIIDYDCGAIIRTPLDSPLTLGTLQEWLAPEIIKQLDPNHRTGPVKASLASDFWSVNVAIHYLLFGLHPYFFLTEATERSISLYTEKFKWPDIDISFPYYEPEQTRLYADYCQFLKTKVPGEIVEEFEVTFNLGYFDPSWRTSYQQWEGILKALSITGKHKSRPQTRSPVVISSQLRPPTKKSRLERVLTMQGRPTVFISYVRENMATVRNLVEELKTARIEVLWDQEPGFLPPGSRWRDKIRDGIEKGDFFIACFSQEFHNREETQMWTELRVACERLRQMPRNRHWFISVILSGSGVPAEPIGSGETLQDLQWANLSLDWERGIKEIVNTVLPPAKLPLEVQAEVMRLQSKDLRTRVLAVKELGRMGFVAAPAVPTLINCLSDENDLSVRRAAAFALARMGDASAPASTAIARCLKDHNRRLRTAAGKAIKQLGTVASGAVSTLIECLRGNDEQMHTVAREALVSIGENAVEPMIRCLNERDHRLRWRTFKGLAQMKSAAPALMRCLKDGADEEVRELSFMALQEIVHKYPSEMEAAAIALHSHVRRREK